MYKVWYLPSLFYLDCSLTLHKVWCLSLFILLGLFINCVWRLVSPPLYFTWTVHWLCKSLVSPPVYFTWTVHWLCMKSGVSPHIFYLDCPLTVYEVWCLPLFILLGLFINCVWPLVSPPLYFTWTVHWLCMKSGVSPSLFCLDCPLTVHEVWFLPLFILLGLSIDCVWSLVSPLFILLGLSIYCVWSLVSPQLYFAWTVHWLCMRSGVSPLYFPWTVHWLCMMCGMYLSIN